MARKPLPPEVQEEWDTFWAPIVAPNGRLDRHKVALELADYSMVMAGAAKVYYEITGGRISKPNTEPSAVLSVANDVDNEIWEQVLADEKERWEEEHLKDVCHVSVRPMRLLGADYWVKAIVPEGTFKCQYNVFQGLVFSDLQPRLPEDWQDTVLEAVKELLKED